MDSLTSTTNWLTFSPSEYCITFLFIQQLSEATETSESAPLFPSAKEEEMEDGEEEVSVKQEEKEEEPGPSGTAAKEEE